MSINFNIKIALLTLYECYSVKLLSTWSTNTAVMYENKYDKKKYDNKAEILTFFKSHSFKNQKNNYFLFLKK